MPGEIEKNKEDQILNLVVPATAEYLSLLRLVVGAAARVVGFNDENIADIKVALSEASTNVVKLIHISRIDINTIGDWAVSAKVSSRRDKSSL